MPMQPRPCSETVRPLLPSLRFFMRAAYTTTAQAGLRTRRRATCAGPLGKGRFNGRRGGPSVTLACFAEMRMRANSQMGYWLAGYDYPREPSLRARLRSARVSDLRGRSG